VSEFIPEVTRPVQSDVGAWLLISFDSATMQQRRFRGLIQISDTIYTPTYVILKNHPQS
jgi:hypothetical protein